jgi:hypothetical protein
VPFALLAKSEQPRSQSSSHCSCSILASDYALAFRHAAILGAPRDRMTRIFDKRSCRDAELD